jgi:hypothetical protein
MIGDRYCPLCHGSGLIRSPDTGFSVCERPMVAVPKPIPDFDEEWQALSLSDDNSGAKGINANPKPTAKPFLP